MLSAGRSRIASHGEIVVDEDRSVQHLATFISYPPLGEAPARGVNLVRLLREGRIDVKVSGGVCIHHRLCVLRSKCSSFGHRDQDWFVLMTTIRFESKS